VLEIFSSKRRMPSMSGIPTQEKNANTPKKNLAFIKEVAKYFMDFLETDFHRRRNPKRSVRLRNKDNLLIGLNLAKYPSFNALVWKAINSAFYENTLKIRKGAHNTNIPSNLLDLLKLQTEKLSQEKISSMLGKVGEEIEKSGTLHKEDLDQAYTVSIENISKIIKQDLVLPFVNSLEKPLENLNLGDENSIYLMEEELSSVLISLLEDNISEILKRLLTGDKIDMSEELQPVFSLREIKNAIYTFFESFEVTDLFAEISDIDRNRRILDKQEFYLYFCDIAFKREKYPIFYIPFTIQSENNVLKLEFDSQVFVNKRALEYVAQEYNEEKGTKGGLETVEDRIIYLADHREEFGSIMTGILEEIVNFFGLDSTIDTNDPTQQVAKSLWTRLSNSCYVAIFDKSDESLVNDYEDILKRIDEEDSVIAVAFNKLIEDFIHKQPKLFNSRIEEDWDNKPTSDRLVFTSPIPLNSEQLHILSALRKDGCKYVTVEGPPGTGKSHTVTAIVFNAIQRNQSVLVLSDKKEALDVVENKINAAMNNARGKEDFQNPILRLGRAGSNYPRIFAPMMMKKIKIFCQATRKNHENLDSDLDKGANTLKEDLEAEVLAYREIDINEIYDLHRLEEYFEKKGYVVDIDEVLSQSDSAIELEEFWTVFKNLRSKLVEDNSEIFGLFNLSLEGLGSFDRFQEFVDFLIALQEKIRRLREFFGGKISLLSGFKELSDDDSERLNRFVIDYEDIRNWLFGYFLKRKQVEELNREFRKTYRYTRFEQPHECVGELGEVLEILDYIDNLEEEIRPLSVSEFDYIKTIHRLLTREELAKSMQEIVALREDIEYLANFLTKYPATMKKSGVDLMDFATAYNNELVRMSGQDINRLVRYVSIRQKIEKSFRNMPELDYAGRKQDLESLATIQMTYIMDGRLVDFYENNQGDARALKGIIGEKRRFPRNQFLKLKNAFPCILAGIRDYAEYIPLEPGIFDLVIIDEASQVSIAQAFPALLRAKKVLILGDTKQFSNVKSAHARTDTNRQYLNNLEDCFKKNVSDRGIEVEKLRKFNIKTSILEFFKFIHNYEAQLLKYFRGYEEIISYSDKHFYGGDLQVMKIRGKPISDVLKFSIIPHDGRTEILQNTNVPEVEFIISELGKLKQVESKSSVCIITPHTNQQKLLMEMIGTLPERDYFFGELKLKIMTFDTCQGEERDIVFYSMVATEESDRLWGVFIKDLGPADAYGKIKAQRLNVGFSRAKECMHFVLSKPLKKYTGSIGHALRYYDRVLEAAKKKPSVSELDPRSKMELKVMHWFHQTRFYKENKDDIEFKPQFEIGKFLKQLDETYTHPSYKVDFLLLYRDKSDREHKIIIEYDGFKEHFEDIDEVNELNYEQYYSDEDVERQKVLESYGYKFLRINRFNIGANPIQTLDDRMGKLLKQRKTRNMLLSSIHETFEGLQNGEKKECPRCQMIKNLDDFRNASLITGYGRFCRKCKGEARSARTRKTGGKATKRGSFGDVEAKKIICPKCGSNMILRNGRYGRFYGCSKFPYCHGTRSYR